MRGVVIWELSISESPKLFCLKSLLWQNLLGSLYPVMPFLDTLAGDFYCLKHLKKDALGQQKLAKIDNLLQGDLF